MKRKLFKNRIISEDKIYLLLPDCADVLETDLKTLKNCCDNIVDIPPFGECILEEEFNHVFRNYFPESPAVEQISYVETLNGKALEIMNLYSLKRFFFEKIFINNAQNHNMTLDEFIEKIDFPKELEKEKEKIKLKKTLKEQILQYKEELQRGIESVKNIPFEKFGLTLQHISVIQNGHIHFYTYYVGEGIFWWVMPEDMEEENWEEAVMDEDGTIRVPSNGYSDGWLVLEKKVSFDFRRDSVKENIMHCLELVDAKDEWQDSLVLRDGGINIEVDKIYLAKIINPRNFLDIYYFDGIPEIEETIIQTND